jgi:hypothetical protein
VTSIDPSASKLRARASRLSERSSGASASEAKPIGTLTRKIHCHESRSVSTPPRSTPAAAPNPPTAPHAPRAMFRSRPSSKVVVRIESAAGEIVAAPSPWRARKEMSDVSLHESPQRSEPSEKSTRPTANTRRRPRRSALRPPSSRKPP